MKRKVRLYIAKKARVFTPTEMTAFITRLCTDFGDIQDCLMVAVAFFGLARGIEAIELSNLDIRKCDSIAGDVTIALRRCGKSQSRSTVVNIPKIGEFNTALHFSQHCDRVKLLGDERIWWKFDSKNQKFCAQHLGKSYMSKLAQKVAKFNGLPDSECFSSHSFRRSGQLHW